MSSYSQVGIKAGFAFAQTIQKNNGGVFYPGFDIGVTYNISDNLRAEILYEGLFDGYKNALIKNTNWIFPITAGIDYSFLNEKFHPYVGLNLGLYNTGVSSRYAGSHLSSSTNHFGFYPKVGINYELTDNLLLDVAAKYHMFISKTNFDNNSYLNSAFGMNIGLAYKF